MVREISQNDVFYGYIAAENKTETIKAIKENEGLIPVFLKHLEQHEEWGRSHEQFVETVIDEIKLDAVSKPVADQVQSFSKKFWNAQYQKLAKAEPSRLFDECLTLCRESHVGVVKSYLLENQAQIDFSTFLDHAVHNSDSTLCDVILETAPRNDSVFHSNRFLFNALEKSNVRNLESFLKHWPEPPKTVYMKQKAGWSKIYDNANFDIINTFYEALPEPHKYRFLRHGIFPFIKKQPEMFQNIMSLFPIEKAPSVLKGQLSYLDKELLQSIPTLYDNGLAGEVIPLLIAGGRKKLAEQLIQNSPPEMRDALRAKIPQG